MDQTGTTYSFGQASGSNWLISEITDDQGGTETFGYTSGELTSITNNVSGRALHLTWSRLAGDVTARGDGVHRPGDGWQPSTALTWTYSYTGDLLSAVCPPGTTTACTKYTYLTNGSHAPHGGAEREPGGLLPSRRPAGTTAAVNEVPVNDLTTVNPPAAEINTTPGVAGPGDNATATGFNGTSSYIPMDGTWCTGGRDKLLHSCGRQQPHRDSVHDEPRLRRVVQDVDAVRRAARADQYLADRLHHGLFRHRRAAGHVDHKYRPASGGGLADVPGEGGRRPVAPGGSHPRTGAVRRRGECGLGAVAFTTPAGDYALLGAGIVAGGNWQFFNGSLADFAVYQNQLPSVGAVAAQYAAELKTAAELTGITSPGGRTEMSASYDTVDDRLASLADAHGGNWKYGSPVTQSLSAGYEDAVLSSSPEDFWPLSDTTGPLAHDLVGGAPTAAVPRPPATYSNVTLGVTGPTGFADGTAAGFSGSGSQIAVPGGYFAGTGGAGESVELWFTATKAGTLLSAGSGTGGDPPTLWVDSSGCVEGTVDGALLRPTTCTPTIGDGKWHQVVLTLTSVETNATGTATIQTATLYEDGKVLSSASPGPATPSAAGYTAVVGNGPDGDFTGSIADVSLYTAALPATDVTAHYDGLHNQVLVQEPGGNPPTFLATPTLNVQTIAVTDPFAKNASYVYASGDLIKTTDVLGGVTWHGYDASNRATTVTDPDGYTTYTTHDAYNNVTSTTTCAAVNDCQTSYESYYENLSNPLDPRNNKPTDERDARSSSPSDPTYDTVITYTGLAELASKSTPPTAACPSGCKTSLSYTTGSRQAVGGGTEPACLRRSLRRTAR